MCVWGGGEGAPHTRGGGCDPCSPGKPGTLRSQGSARAGAARPCAPPRHADLRAAVKASLSPPLGPGARGELPATLRPAGGKIQSCPAVLPPRGSLTCPPAPEAAGWRPPLRRASPGVRASPPPAAAVQRRRLGANGTHSPRKAFLPGASPVRAPLPGRREADGPGRSPPPLLRRSAPRAWPASSGVAPGGPRSSLRPPERAQPARPHACWVPARPDSSPSPRPGIRARRRPKPGNRDAGPAGTWAPTGSGGGAAAVRVRELAPRARRTCAAGRRKSAWPGPTGIAGREPGLHFPEICVPSGSGPSWEWLARLA